MRAAAPTAQAEAGPPIAARLAGFAAMLLAALPAVMAAANRSSPVVVGLAALLFLAAAVAAEGWRTATERLAEPLATPLGLAALAFLGWCAVSVAWSPLPALSLRHASEFLPTLLAGFLVARLAPPHLGPVLRPAGWLLLATCLFIEIDLATDVAVRRLLHERAFDYVYNRPLELIVLLSGPVAVLLARRGSPLLALLAAAAAGAAAWFSASGASALAAIVAAATYGLARLLPQRAMVALAGLGLMGALALAPLEGDVLAAVMPPRLHAEMAASNTRERVVIAQSFGAAVAADPWRGTGFGTSARFDALPVARRLDPEMRPMLTAGHPHNSFLQVWAELGIVGAALAAIVLLLTLRALSAWPKPDCAAALAAMAAAAGIAFVGHGAWQGWWIAGLGALVAWLRAMRHSAKGQGDAPWATEPPRTISTSTSS
ncbi:O-antigen ligase family protein [Methylobacterium nodulans]|uniref:O-antigen polymerase n=1 Tax=Methylobacterium nodulans (strain LMG 21967 / CNCM I-2342 / ORS 2060) TaxID=460265 RepID=B8IEG2_METNO|nr:O-antigen ligase family protein [Methylobacterium nodulans]ACL59534.1 O-antigen polymerase [Methylobacterium nodulans ORS 2060]